MHLLLNTNDLPHGKSDNLLVYDGKNVDLDLFMTVTHLNGKKLKEIEM